MSERKINLEEILQKHIKSSIESERHKSTDSVINAMREACRQILELAAENAEVDEHEVAESIHGGPGYTYYEVDKQSILNTINQIE